MDPSATIGPDVFLGPHVSVGAGATVGARSVLLAGVHVGDDARIGEDCLLHPRATLLERCIVGDRVILHSGSVIGSDGFGYAFSDGTVQKIPQVGNVVLGSDVEIGANTCIDRAQTGATLVGEGTKIDNLVQIGHNCRIGKHGAFAALSGIAGSTIIGDHVKVGGACGFAGHLTVGSHVTIGGHSMVYRDVPDGAQISGIPAQEHREELRQQVRLRKLPKLYDRVAALEQK